MVADQRSGGKLASIALMYCAERYWTIDARCQVAEASAVNRVPDCLGCLDLRSQCSSGGSSGGKQMHSASAVNLTASCVPVCSPWFSSSSLCSSRSSRCSNSATSKARSSNSCRNRHLSPRHHFPMRHRSQTNVSHKGETFLNPAPHDENVGRESNGELTTSPEGTCSRRKSWLPHLATLAYESPHTEITSSPTTRKHALPMLACSTPSRPRPKWANSFNSPTRKAA